MDKDFDVHFTVHPGIFQVLGGQLVSDTLRALSELVKNSYDADASVAEVSFEEKPTRSIVVSDDGHGMSLLEIRKGWLQIGTPLKRDRTESEEKGRPYSGSMGIGRLAAFSISDQVVLETGRNLRNWFRVSLSLKKLSSARSFDDLSVPVSRVETPALNHGTIIRLLNPEWWPTEEEMENLKRRLSLLRGPKEKSEFRVVVSYDGRTQELVLEEELPTPPLTVTARIQSDHRAKYRILADPGLYQGSHASREKIKETGWEFVSRDNFPLLGGARLVSFWYPRGDRPAGDYWQRIDADSLRDITGVRLYRDGIRVLPYGEPGNDWLGLEAKYVRAGATSRRPRPSGLVGWISVSRLANAELIDTANREGLLENEAFHQLSEFANEAFTHLAEVRRQIEPVIREPRQLTERVLGKALRGVSKLKAAVEESPKLASQVEFLENVLDAVRAEFELISLYRDRLTAGNLVRFVLHDVGASLRITSELLEAAAAEKCDVPSHAQALRIVNALVPRVLGAYSLLKGAGRSGAYRRSTFDASALTRSIVDQFKSTLSSQVSFRVDANSIMVKAREADVWSLVVNLVHNAATSGEFDPGRPTVFPPSREVVVRLRRRGDDLLIECEDNGPGLPDKPEGWIWEPFNSTRRGGGSGLGLWIVSDLVTWYGGTKEATETKHFSSGALFRITLPRIVANA